jgi:hypothetical protein
MFFMFVYCISLRNPHALSLPKKFSFDEIDIREEHVHNMQIFSCNTQNWKELVSIRGG